MYDVRAQPGQGWGERDGTASLLAVQQHEHRALQPCPRLAGAEQQQSVAHPPCGR